MSSHIFISLSNWISFSHTHKDVFFWLQFSDYAYRCVRFLLFWHRKMYLYHSLTKTYSFVSFFRQIWLDVSICHDRKKIFLLPLPCLSELNVEKCFQDQILLFDCVYTDHFITFKGEKFLSQMVSIGIFEGKFSRYIYLSW